MRWKVDDFLSAVLKRRAFSVRLPTNMREQDTLKLRRMLESGAADFVSAKTPVDDTAAQHYLRPSGFVVVDELITLEKPWQLRREVPAIAGYFLRWAEGADEPAVVDLAGTAFRCSRWHADPAFSLVEADAVKAAWAANYFRGRRGEAMAIVAKPQKAVGFLQIFSKDSALVFDLIAVHEAHRGRGLGTALVVWAQAAWTGSPSATVRVGTQRRNVAALALYNNLGFTEVGRHYVWHWHRRK